MSRLASLFAVPLAMVGQDDLNSKEESSSNGPQRPTDNEHPGPSKALEKKPNDVVKLNIADCNAPTRKRKKNKNQTRPTSGRTYVDYDKSLEEDESSAVWAWPGASLSTSCNHEMVSDTSITSPSTQREVVSYQELSHLQNSSKNRNAQQRRTNRPKNFPPGVQNGFHLLGQRNLNSIPGQQNNPNSNLSNLNRTQSLKRKSDLPYPNKMPRMNNAENNSNGNVPSKSIALMSSFIDPMVAATEPRELFEKPRPVVVNNRDVRKPLNSKQKKKMEKAKFYKEKLRLQKEKEIERIVSLKQLPCRFFSLGNCTKGAECPFSHEFVPQKKPELCKFYVISFCERGGSCVYYHGDWPCKFFHAYRSCTQGDRCRFSHLPLTDETRPLLEKSLSDNNCPSENYPSVPVAGSSSNPANQRIGDARAQGPVSFFGTEHAARLPGMPWQMPANGYHHVFHQPWNKKLELIDVGGTGRSEIPADMEQMESSVNDPRIKEHLLRKDKAADYVASYKREPLVLLESPRVTFFCLDAPDSSAYFNGSRPSTDPGLAGKVDGDGSGVCFLANPASPEDEIRGSSGSSSSSNPLSARDLGETDEVRSARHLSLPIMQIAARGSSDKLSRVKRGNGLSTPDF